MTIILQRGDTQAAWASANPVLMAREVGWEMDTRRVKIGDGVTAWNALPYVVEGEVTSVNGRTGAVTLTALDVGLGAVDNTPDLNKPISVATQTALDNFYDALNAAKADIESPEFQGDPTAPTPVPSDSSDKIATTQYVTNAIDLLDLPQAGAHTITVGASTNVFESWVTFPRPWPAGTEVRVTVTQRTGIPHFYGAWLATRDHTGFLMRVTKTGTSGASSITADWIAMPETGA